MPFTLSHAILAPPLRKLSRNTLPTAALAIGCMTPDLIRLFTNENILISHQFSGLIVPDLFIGLFFCLLWYLLIRPVTYLCFALVDPIRFTSINHFCQFCLMSMMAIIIGSVTHIVWDGLTHNDFRTLAFQGFLSSHIVIIGHNYSVARIMQIGTSIVTLPIVIWLCYCYIRKQYQSDHRNHFLNIIGCIIFTFSALIGGFFLLDYHTPIHYELWQDQRYFVTGNMINYFFRGFLLSLTACCIVFQSIFFASNK